MPLDYKIYSDEYIGLTDPQGLPTLEVTWWGLETEAGMDDILTKAGDSLQPMFDRLKISPMNGTKEGLRLFLAQYILGQDGSAKINYLAGFQIDCIEMMVTIGEYSSLTEDVLVLPPDKPGLPPMPDQDQLFRWPNMSWVIFNHIDAAQKNIAEGLTVKLFADSLNGDTPKTHWFIGTALSGDRADTRVFPVPGEFVSLGLRILPWKVWGDQKSSPFLYSGNWADSVFYTSGVVKEVVPASDAVSYPTYQVQWRKDVVTAVPTDFAEYQVGARVSILKSVDTTKTEQKWTDEDVQAWNNKWVLVPINFYDDGSGHGL